MDLFNSVLQNVDYKKILSNAIKDTNVQEVMADFINHCLENCVETNDIVNKIVEQKVQDIVTKSNMKANYFS